MAKPISHPIKKLVHLSEDQAARISEFRFSQRISSENEAIRQLIEVGLNAETPVTSEAHRQSQAVASSAKADEDQAFIDTASK